MAPEERLAGDPDTCPSDPLLRMLWGAWKIHILWSLGTHGPQRFGALGRRLGEVSPKVLTDRLRSMEADGLIWRKQQPTRALNVRYGLTAKGEALHDALEGLHGLGERWPDIEP